MGATAPTAPASALFQHGYNKRKAASLAALNKTTGKTFTERTFDG